MGRGKKKSRAEEGLEEIGLGQASEGSRTMIGGKNSAPKGGKAAKGIPQKGEMKREVVALPRYNRVEIPVTRGCWKN